MGPYINKVQKEITSLANSLFDLVPNIEIGIIGHSDYDYTNPLDHQPLTSSKQNLQNFMKNLKLAYGSNW